jgi:hypothetical protein
MKTLLVACCWWLVKTIDKLRAISNQTYRLDVESWVAGLDFDVAQIHSSFLSCNFIKIGLFLG